MRIRGDAGSKLAVLSVSGFRREYAGHDFPHDRHDRQSERGVLQPPSDRAARACRVGRIRHGAEPGPDSSRGRLHADEADVLLRLIAQERVTFTHCVPTIQQMLLGAPGSKDVDLSGLKMVVGGSALPRALARAALARGIDVFTGYGQSESRPMLSGVHLTTKQLSEDPERQVELRTFAGLPAP